MKFTDLVESYEDVPEVDTRRLSLEERIAHYEFLNSMYHQLMEKAYSYFYAHEYYQRNGPADQRMYEYRSEAKDVTRNMNPNIQGAGYVSVKNIRYTERDKRAYERDIKFGRPAHDASQRFVPITAGNEKFRRKLAETVYKFGRWKEAANRALASVERLRRQQRIEHEKQMGWRSK